VTRMLLRRLALSVAAGLSLGMILTTAAQCASASAADDQKTVAALDKAYQTAVKNNDVATISRILADNFVLVTGSGKTCTKADMVKDANGDTHYEHNDEETQIVRVYGDTAIVTAKLWEKYTVNGKSYEHKFWFSDTYVRTPKGWKYVFGQSSLPLPSTTSVKR
jgi:ketosteroid isomerase-like protein